MIVIFSSDKKKYQGPYFTTLEKGKGEKAFMGLMERNLMKRRGRITKKLENLHLEAFIRISKIIKQCILVQ